MIRGLQRHLQRLSTPSSPCFVHKLLIFECFLIKAVQGARRLGWRGEPPGYPQALPRDIGITAGGCFAAHRDTRPLLQGNA